MATDTSYAAAHDEKAFSVEILSGEEETTVVAEALRDFFEALDSAMDWVEREDPERTQSSSIGIFATSHGVREQVWAYPSEAAEVERNPTPLVELFGFDPVAWKAPASEYERLLGLNAGPGSLSRPIMFFIAVNSGLGEKSLRTRPKPDSQRLGLFVSSASS